MICSSLVGACLISAGRQPRGRANGAFRLALVTGHRLMRATGTAAIRAAARLGRKRTDERRCEVHRAMNVAGVAIVTRVALLDHEMRHVHAADRRKRATSEDGADRRSESL